jgi:N-acetylmuramoyl-L-alanine amidase
MKKYYIIILVSFCILTIILNIKNVSASLPLIGKIIIIDPGHGGLDPGTSGGKIYEKDINLEISKSLEKELIKLGANAILTRNGDYDLSTPNTTWRKKSDFDNRIKLINNSGANLYLSIHLNYLNETEYHGAQVFYDQKNERLAKIIQKHLNTDLKNNREIKKIPSSTYMYSKLKIPGVLIECGFLSNYGERNMLITKTYQEKLASTIAKSLPYYY